MGEIERIFKILKPVEHSFTVLKQSPEAVEDFSIKKVVHTQEVTANADHAVADTAYIPNVLYNTDAVPPAANTVPIGTIYIQYTP